MLSGSSPRGRGKLLNLATGARDSGLIPARAGKTRRRRNNQTPPRAHPRAGGENQVQVLKAHFGDGSSPRGRGKRGYAPWRPSDRRLIPARAGKTFHRRLVADRCGAHPRAGGENVVSGGVWSEEAGSSPRGRGKPCAVRIRRPPLRLIPARAGKTTSPPCSPAS